MTIFQKLSWMMQMGIRDLCGEAAHPLESAHKSISPASLDKLEKKIQKSKSAISATATHALGGVGVTPAKVLCVLDMPSATEDRTGVALSGSEGELLKKMLGAIGLDISRQTHVAYLSPWRSPGARVLTNIETKEGLNLLNERIQLVSPKVILLFGMPVAKALLNIPLGQARSKIHTYKEIPCFTTFAPSFLLKNGDYKKGAWEDLKKVHSYLKEEK